MVILDASRRKQPAPPLYVASLTGPGKPLSQRHLAEKYGIDRRKVKQIITSVQHTQ